MIKIDKHGGETHKNDLTFAILAGIEKYDAEVLDRKYTICTSSSRC